jgi:hypothetical protein
LAIGEGAGGKPEIRIQATTKTVTRPMRARKSGASTLSSHSVEAGT